METNIPKEMRDEVLWRTAKKRAGFKWSFLMYVIVNVLLIAIWYFTSGDESYFWPMWPILGWGLGIAIQYFEAYHGNNFFSVQNEYEKLKKMNNE